MSRNDKKAHLLLFGVAASWGISLPLTKLIINDIGIFTLLFFRFLIGGIITATIFWKRLRKIKLRTVATSFFLAAIMSLVNILETYGLKFTTATNAAFLSGLSLIIVPLISFLIFKERPGRRWIFGTLLSLVGFYFLTAGDKGLTSLNKGDGIILLSAFVYALYIMSVDHFVDLQDSIPVGILVLLFSALIYMVLMFLPTPVPIMQSGKLLTVLLIISFACTAFAYSGHIIAQKHTSTIRAALILMTEPIFATLFSLIIPDSAGNTETLTLFKVIGILLMTLGMISAEFGHIAKN